MTGAPRAWSRAAKAAARRPCSCVCERVWGEGRGGRGGGTRGGGRVAVHGERSGGRDNIPSDACMNGCTLPRTSLPPPPSPLPLLTSPPPPPLCQNTHTHLHPQRQVRQPQCQLASDPRVHGGPQQHAGPGVEVHQAADEGGGAAHRAADDVAGAAHKLGQAAGRWLGGLVGRCLGGWWVGWWVGGRRSPREWVAVDVGMAGRRRVWLGPKGLRLRSA